MTPDPARLGVLALRTPTIPPATHTNTYRLGNTVIDPASPYPEEQARLLAWLGGRCDRILLTHHHGDHIGGVMALRAATGASVWAHPDSRLPFPIDHPVVDGDRIDTGEGVLIAFHTPGHADGHLVFHLEGTDHVVCGDLVAGIGTIVLAPPEGHLATYLASLRRIRPLVGTLHPAHGPSLPDGPAILDHYAAHRHHRTAQFRGAIAAGDRTAVDIATRVYAGIPGVDPILAALQVRAHLQWMREAGEAGVPE